jgi:hypothetical protein
MGSKLSKVRTPAAAAGNTSISTSRSASVDGSVGQHASRSSSRRGSQESAGSVDTVFSVLSDLIVCHRKAALRTVKKRFIIRGMHGGIRLERARGFKQYRKELEMLLEASGVVQNYFGTLWRFPDKQAGKLDTTSSVRLQDLPLTHPQTSFVLSSSCTTTR